MVSTDHHTVKPWFSGRIALSPPVADFAGQGFALTGGRIQTVDGIAMAVVVYRHDAHQVDLFVWPAKGRWRGGLQRLARDIWRCCGRRAIWILPPSRTWIRRIEKIRRSGARRAGNKKSARCRSCLHTYGDAIMDHEDHTARARSNAWGLAPEHCFPCPAAFSPPQAWRKRPRRTRHAAVFADQRHPYRLQAGRQSRCGRHPQARDRFGECHAGDSPRFAIHTGDITPSFQSRRSSTPASSFCPV